MQADMQDQGGTTEARWAALMRASVAGDGRAYGRLLTEITPVLRGIVRARGRTFAPDQHEDIVQEVLLSIHAKRHTWKADHPIKPWLYAITRHKVVDAFRKRGASVDLPIEDFEDVLEADAGPDPTAARDVEVLVGRLDVRSAAIVRAVALEELPHAEVSARLGMTDAALRVALHRAMKTLQGWGKGA
jgi:RNA polymerase sigma-70 factor (ECF subfamily)